MKNTILLTFLFLIVLANSTKAQLSFAPHVTYGTGTGSNAVFSADFNGDGKMDLATANHLANNVSVLLGSGTGTFAAAVNYAVGVEPHSIFSADFNGDGKMDLATANFNTNSVSVLLGSGTGTFAAAVDYAAGVQPISVFSADFNGDGKRDLAVANYGGNNVSVLLGSGTGTFGAAANYAVGTNPISVFSADFNGDGKMDLVTANLFSDNVSVLLGSGTGTFAAAVNYAPGFNPVSVFSADFNGDGKMDLAVANNGGSNVSVLLGSGTGTFSAAVNYAVGTDPRSIFSADFNGDGKMDLAVANNGGNNVSVLLGSGTGTFAAAVNYAVGTNPRSVFSADFNGDGKMDLTTANYTSNNASVLLNTSIPPCAATLSLTGQSNVLCNGGATGSATVTATGGAPYTYIWSPSGGSSATASGLSAGVYTCVVTNSCGATASTTVTITEPTVITSSISSQTNNTCNGGTNGAASVLAGGGTAPYTYSWSPSGGTAATASSLAAGTYTCTITDANSCTKTQNVTITQPSAITSSVSSQTNVSCNGGTNGAATVLAGGGTAPYTYSWSPSGGTAATATGLGAGAYTCTITDANSCTKTQNVTITQPTAITSSVSTQTNVSCNGGTNGAATVLAGGGTAPYTYSWSPSGGTAATATGLAAGVYTCTITDANSCTKTQNVTITQLAAISYTSITTNVSCFAGNNGAINITAAGGTAPYTYNWGGGITTEDRTGLASGTYNVTITDANACSSSFTISITQPSALSSSIAITNASCFAASDGELDITVTGGTVPYGYFWISSLTSEDLTGRSAGTYWVEIADANGCTLNDTAIVSQPSEIVSASVITNVDCNGNSTGEIDIVPSGGVGPYTYDWGSSITTEDRTGLAAGSYSIVIEDATACVSNITVVVTEPSVLAVSTSQVNILCNGDATGSINTTVTGGTSPYTFDWGGGITTEDLANIEAGMHNVTVTDAKGCTTTASVTLTEPTNISVVKDSLNILCFGDNSGMANVTVSGGVGPYTYTWIGTSAFTSTANYLTAGNYSVEITDNNGCVKVATFEIGQNPVITSSFNVSQCDPYTWGSNFYPTSGTYQQIFSAVNGCDSIVTLNLLVHGYPAISIAASETIVCKGENVTLSATGGISTATWDNGVIDNQVFVPTSTNTYTATVANAQGCESSESIDVYVRELPIVLMEQFTDSTCFDVNLVACPFATPAGGDYSGSGVTGFLLNTQTAGLGQHEVVYTYSDQYGCTNSDTSMINIVECELPVNETGIDENAAFSISIFPNPTNGELTIQSQIAYDAILTDALGRVVQVITLNPGSTTVSIENEADGVYFVLFDSNRSIYKVVKQ